MKHQLGLPEDYGIPDSDGEQGGCACVRHRSCGGLAYCSRVLLESDSSGLAVWQRAAFMTDLCLYPDLLQVAGSMRRLQRQLLLRKQR